MFVFRPIVIRIEIPALSDLVALLKEQDQAGIDARTAAVVALKDRLKRANDGLRQAANSQAK